MWQSSRVGTTLSRLTLSNLKSCNLSSPDEERLLDEAARRTLITEWSLSCHQASPLIPLYECISTMRCVRFYPGTRRYFEQVFAFRPCFLDCSKIRNNIITLLRSKKKKKSLNDHIYIIYISYRVEKTLINFNLRLTKRYRCTRYFPQCL